jgi:hypothetical protein
MKPRTLLLIAMVLLASVARVLPHPPNFSPVDAVALFCAAFLGSRWAAFLVPLAVMLLGDLGLEAAGRLGFLGGWMAGGQGIHPGMGVVYLAVALVAALGLVLRRHRSVPMIGACTLGGSVIFFLVTNFAWWAGYDLYPHTAEGLIESYTAALPFFHWTVLGDVCFSTVLFGGFAWAEKRFPALQAGTGQA